MAPRLATSVTSLLAGRGTSTVLATSQGTSEIPHGGLTQAAREVFDLRPCSISKRLGLKRPLYGQTNCYGHFGLERRTSAGERADAVDDLRTALHL